MCYKLQKRAHHYCLCTQRKADLDQQQPTCPHVLVVEGGHSQAEAHLGCQALPAHRMLSSSCLRFGRIC